MKYKSKINDVIHIQYPHKRMFYRARRRKHRTFIKVKLPPPPPNCPVIQLLLIFAISGQLSGFTDEVLSTLFAVKAELCNQKFELKVNDVRFVAHPTLMQSKSGKEEQSGSSILINIVFALYAQASYSIVKCYYELSKRLGNALVYEENRVGYLTDEMKLILKTHDEVAENVEEGRAIQGYTAFDHVLDRSTLALCLKTVNTELSFPTSPSD